MAEEGGRSWEPLQRPVSSSCMGPVCNPDPGTPGHLGPGQEDEPQLGISTLNQLPPTCLQPWVAPTSLESKTLESYLHPSSQDIDHQLQLPTSTPPPLLWSPAPVHLLVMLLEGLIDFGYLKSQQMRSGSCPRNKPLHLYDPIPLLLRQESHGAQPGLELTTAEASNPPHLPPPPWAGMMTSLCQSLAV